MRHLEPKYTRMLLADGGGARWELNTSARLCALKTLDAEKGREGRGEGRRKLRKRMEMDGSSSISILFLFLPLLIIWEERTRGEVKGNIQIDIPVLNCARKKA